MAEQVIKPDLDFVKGVIAAGGDSLKKCYQCATCSVVCNVTPDQNPFPRKEMVWAQWGLKEKFKGNPDVWLCHQCNDCTAYCPRDAKPGEVLGAIRKQTIAQYSSPSALVDFVNNKSSMILLILIPAVIVGLVISMFGSWSPEGEVIFSNFMPILAIQFLFTPALLFGVGVGIMGMRKFWADMKEANGVTTGDLKGSVTAMFKELMSHEKFKECDESKDRATSHLLVFYSFIALGIATALGVLYIDILHLESPFRFGYGTPIKIFGTVGAIAILAGSYLMMSNRFKHADRVGLGSYFDWLLIGLIGTIGVSGTLAWLTRVAGIGGLAYPLYFIHLVVVLSLFVYLPFSKLAHMFYRGAALSFNKYSGREALAEAQPAVEAAAAPVKSPSESEQTGTETKQESGQE
ncbi:MAG: quinone-interacting membrane-bound oxidoreductase complex subunit QmoC [Nitrospiraceae bacterium]|nr:MAG: quinone-interacting membrane-bound oxidoreductase complex subunit QmoC [Nitrospiraceae bacterium]